MEWISFKFILLEFNSASYFYFHAEAFLFSFVLREFVIDF